jgi:hypothetical protein
MQYLGVHKTIAVLDYLHRSQPWLPLSSDEFTNFISASAKRGQNTPLNTASKDSVGFVQHRPTSSLYKRSVIKGHITYTYNLIAVME